MSSKSYPITLINGKQESAVSPMDRGLAYGDGVFETMLVVDGQIPLWSYHHARLLKGLLHLNISVESQRLRHEIDHMLSLVQDTSGEKYIFKLIITRGQGGRGYQATNLEPTSVLSLSPYTIDKGYFNGVKVHICQQRLPIGLSWAGLKTLNQLPYVLAAQERQDTDYHEGILLSINEHVVEATARNIFIVKNEQLYTPELKLCGVSGVMRQFIIEKILPQLGLQCIEQELSVTDLQEAEEIFITNGISGVWPIIQVEQSKLEVGPVARSIQAMAHGLLGLFGD